MFLNILIKNKKKIKIVFKLTCSGQDILREVFSHALCHCNGGPFRQSCSQSGNIQPPPH